MPVSGSGGGLFPSTLTSEVVAYQDGVTISWVRIDGTYTGGTIAWQVKTDSNSWEDINENTRYTLTNSGEKLYYRAVGQGGVQLTRVRIQYG